MRDILVTLKVGGTSLRFCIRQRVFSWGNKFDIYDENGKPVFHCQGEVFSFGKKLHLYEISGREIAYIEQKLFTFMPRYEIYIDNVLATTVIKKFSLFRHDFVFEQLNWEISGDFFAHEYTIDSNGKNVMSMSKKWFSWGDVYNIDINDGFNPQLVLTAALVVDSVCHDNRN